MQLGHAALLLKTRDQDDRRRRIYPRTSEWWRLLHDTVITALSPLPRASPAQSDQERKNGRGAPLTMQLGIRAILGTSFAGIFTDNAANNGLLLVTLDEADIARLAERASDPERNQLTVDLPGQ